MKKLIGIILLLASGCYWPMSSYQWQAFELEDGCLVTFSCYVDRRPDGLHWREEDAVEWAKIVVRRDFAEESRDHDFVEILGSSMSEGGLAGVTVAIGSKRFVEEWKAKGFLTAGHKIAELRAANRNLPSFMHRGKR
jgi:hypothetical protein